MLKEIIHSVNGFDATTGNITQNFKQHEKKINWLKALSLKKRLDDVDKLCSNEWSDEDEKMLQYVIGSIDTNISDSNFKNIRIWFEIIKNRVQSQPHWKPSKEQIGALERAIIKMHTPDDIDILAELRDNLKKL